MRVFQYDVCSFLILTLVLISTYIRKLNKGHTQKLFLVFVILVYLNTIADIICSAPLTIIGSPGSSVREVSTYVYFLLHACLMPLYIIFMGTAAGTWLSFMSKTKVRKIVFSVPYLVNIAAILSNPWTHWIFTFEHGTYERGKYILLLYVVGVFYMFYTVYYLIRYRGTLDKRQVTALVSLYPYSVFAIILQFFYPSLLVEMFAYTVAVLTILIFIIRPEEVINSAVGARTSIAFRTEMQRAYLSGREYDVIIIKINSDSSILKLYGINQHDFIIRELVRRVHISLKSSMDRMGDYNVFYLNYGLLAVSMESKYAKEENVHKLFEALNIKISAENFDISPECVVCDIAIPKDLLTVEDLLNFIDTFEKSDIEPSAFIYSKLTKQEKIKMNFDIDRYIRKAISNKSFQMYYQPIYCVKENKFVTAEALIRLKDDEVGFISPALFIPAAEKSGAIFEIGDFVIDSVFGFVQKAEQYGVRYIEINISVMQCMSSSFVNDVMNKLSQYGVSNKAVNFELTESASDFLDDALSRTVTLLNSEGIEFSIDDYGTGYSNLHRIMSEPIKLIKIDRSLINQLNNDKTRAVIADTIRMIKSIGMEIVAEGVETADTANWLIEKGCDYIQGFYYAKPMPEDEYIEFLKLSG